MNEQTENKQTALTSDISFEVGYKDDKTRFDLRFISVSEEQEVAQKLNDISDSDERKSEKEYRVCLTALIDFSSEENNSLRVKFSEFNVKNERIIRAAYSQFRLALQPDVNFF